MPIISLRLALFLLIEQLTIVKLFKSFGDVIDVLCLMFLQHL